MTKEIISVKELLEAGVHFGHQTPRWNPKMKQYIFGERDKIYIIDLQQTQKQLEEAYQFVKQTVSKGKTILFVGTKKQAQEIIKEEAIRCGMPYVTTRWLGGTLTNFQTIKKRIDKLLDMERQEETKETDFLTKKELSKFLKQKQKLLRNLEGIKNMGSLPAIVFIIDVRHEKTAVAEAQKLNIPAIALVDTNSDPDPIEYLVVGNDDAIKSIKIITGKIADAVLSGKQALPAAQPEESSTVES